jgi:hypothetical protein
MTFSERDPIFTSREVSSLVVVEGKAEMRLRRYDFRV